MTKVRKHFDSWAEFLDEIRQPAIWGDSSESSPSEWNGNVTYSQALNLAEYGWPEGREYMNDVSVDLPPDSIQVTEETRRDLDVAGAFPDIARAVAGDPCHMVSIEQSEVSSKVIMVYVTVWTRCSATSKQIMTMGGAVVSYIDALESAGWRCEIHAIGQTDDGGNSFGFDICVKNAGEHLDIDRLAFIMAHPASLRRLQFRLLERCPAFRSSHARHYGFPVDNRPNDANVFVPQVSDIRGPKTADNYAATIAASLKQEESS